MSKFLRIKGVKTFDEAIQEALEEERLSGKLHKYCSYCKMYNHNTTDCNKKRIFQTFSAQG